MGLNGTGKGSYPVHNSKGKTVNKVKFSPTGGSIAPNNTDFQTGSITKSALAGAGGGLSSKGQVNTSKSLVLKNTGRPTGGKMTQTNKLPARMTQLGSKKIPIGKNRYGQPTTQTQTARGAQDTTVTNLKSYLARKAKGEVR